MPKIRALFILGIIIVILPTQFIGVPYEWKSFLIAIMGAAVSFLTFLHYKELKRKDASRESTLSDSSFEDNRAEDHN